MPAHLMTVARVRFTVIFVALTLAATSVAAQTIHGVVKDSGGVAIANAVVQLEYANGGVRGSVTTPASGVYSFTSLPDGVYRVRVFSDPGRDLVGCWYSGVNEFDTDLATLLTVRATTDITADFSLGKASTISGSVAGLSAGQTANVEAYDAATDRYRGSAGTDPVSFTFTINSLPAGQYKLRVRPNGTDRAVQWYSGKAYQSAANAVPLGADQDLAGISFTLGQGASISGTLTLNPAAGDPGATFPAMSVQALDTVRGQWVNGTAVAANGTYTISNLPPGTYVLEAQTGMTGYIREIYTAANTDQSNWQQGDRVTVSAGGTATANFTLEKGGTINGHVFLDQGTPDDVQQTGEPSIAGAWVNANCGIFGAGAQTDADGNYSMAGIRPGSCVVNVGPSPGASDRFVPEWYNGKSMLGGTGDSVTVTVGATTTVNFGVLAGEEISGTVFADQNANDAKDTTEPVIANAQVQLRSATTGACCIGAWTGGDGVYHARVPAGSYFVQAWDNQNAFISEFHDNKFFSDQANAVNAPATGIDFSLVPGSYYGALTGRVIGVGADAGGLAGVDVRVYRLDTGWGVAYAQTDASGNFSVTNLAPGMYRVMFDTYQYNVARNTDYIPVYWTKPADPADQTVVFPTSVGAGTALGTVTLAVGGSITGTVSNRDYATLPANLGVDLQTNWYFAQVLPSATVGTGGAFAIRGVAPGNYYVHLTAHGTPVVGVYYLNSSASAANRNVAALVSVTAGQATAGIVLYPFAGGTISGVVKGGGTPIANVNVNTDMQNGGYWAWTNTRQDGTYELTGLPPAAYRVNTNINGGPWANQTRNDVTVSGTATTILNFDLVAGGTVSGSIVLDTALPNPGQVFQQMWVNLLDRTTGQPVVWRTTNWDGQADGKHGTYTLSNVPAGTWILQLNTGNSGFIGEVWTAANTNPSDWRNGDIVTVTAGTTATANFALELGGTITGKVFLDTVTANDVQETGEASIVGAWVNANMPGWGAGQPTGADGRYTISGLRPGTYTVNVTPASAGTQFLAEWYNGKPMLGGIGDPVVVAGGASVTLDFGVQPGVEISGTVFADQNANDVKDAGESVLANAHVQLRNATTGACCIDAYTGADGVYRARVPAGSFFVQAWDSQGLFIAESHDNKFFSDQANAVTAPASGIDFSLVPGTYYGALTGRLVGVGADASGLAGVDVRIYRYDTGWGAGNVRTDATGNFSFANLPPGTYRVEFDTHQYNIAHSTNYVPANWSNPGNPTNYAVIFPTTTGAGTALGTVTLEVGGSITGTVSARDCGGSLPSGLSINVHPMTDSSQVRPWGDVGTGGSYTIRGLRADSYRVQLGTYGTSLVGVYYLNAQASASSYNLATLVPVTAGQSTSGIDLFPYAGGTISGIVKGNGTPLASVEMRIDLESGGYWGGRQTSQNGTYEFTGLPSGSYRVWTEQRTGPWANAMQNGVTVTGTGTTVVNFDLVAGGSISGTLTLDTTPADPAATFQRISINALDPATGRSVVWRSPTWDGQPDGKHGSYTLTNLAAGNWILQVYTGGTPYVSEVWTAGNTNPPDWRNGDLIPVTAGNASTANLTLESGGTITGKVFLDQVTANDVQESGEPAVVGAWVTARSSQYRGNAQTDADGRYTITGLRPGTYTLDVSQSGGGTAFVNEYYSGRPMMGGTGDPVQLAAGASFTADFGVLPGVEISGIVFADLNGNGAKDTGEPFITTATVQLGNGVTGACCIDVPVAGDGTYRARVPDAGPYWVKGRPNQSGYASEFYHDKFFQSQADPVTAPAANIDFSLVPSASFAMLQGRVVTGTPPSETGLGGVRVRVQPFGGGGDVASVLTNADGTYNFGGMAPGTYQVQFDTSELNASSSSNWVATYWSSDGTSGTINTDRMKVVHGSGTTDLGPFRLVAGGSISGTVHPSQGDTALPQPLYVNAQSFESSGAWLPNGRVAADGTYIIRGLPAPATYRLQAALPQGADDVPVYYLKSDASTWDYNTAGAVQVTVNANTPDANVFLEHGGSVEGHVTSAASGHPPVTSTWIWAELRNDSLRRNYSRGVSGTSDGHYLLTGLPAGQYNIRAQDNSGVLALKNYPGLVTVTAGATTSPIDFELDPAGSISGTATYKLGTTSTPLVGLHIYATDYVTNEWLGGANTNETGAYTIGGLPLGRQYRLRASPRNSVSTPYFDFMNFVAEFYDNQISYNSATPVPNDVAGLTGNLQNINFELALGGSISGVVTDSQGKPLQNVWLWPEDVATGQGFDSNNTDHNGFYLLRGLPGGASYRVRADAYPQPYVQQWWQNTTDRNQAMPVAVTSNATTANIDFSLTRAFLIDGTVKTAGGAPISGVRVDARTLAGSTVSSGTSDASGHYQMYVAPGQYRLVPDTSNTDYAPATFDVTVDADKPNVDLTLPLGATITGHVYLDGTNTTGVANVLVQAFDWATGSFLSSATTNADGSYRIRGLATGSLRVQMETDSRNYMRLYYPDTLNNSSPLAVTAPNETGNVNFHVIAGNEIRGFAFYDANGNGKFDQGEAGLNNININLNPVSGSIGGSTNTGQDGHYVLHGVYPGDYRVVGRAQGTPYATEFYLLSGGDPVGTFKRDLATVVTVKAPAEGPTTSIDFSLILGGGIKGIVTGDGGAPLGNIQININPKDWQGPGFGMRTDSTGHYVMTGLSFGAGLPWTVQVSDPAGLYVGVYYVNELFSNNATGVIVQQRPALSDPLATEANFALSKGGFVEGTVFADKNGNGMLDSGEAIAGANVQVQEFASPNRMISSTNSNADGTFRVGAIPANMNWRVQANPPSGSDYIRVFYKPPIGTPDASQAQSISVTTPGGTVSGVLLGAIIGGAIQGTVTDGNGDPIANVQMCTEAIAPAQVGGCAWTATSGVYTIHGLSPGTHRVKVNSAPGYPTEYYNNQPDRSFASPVTVVENGTTTGINFRLVRTPSSVGALSVTSANRGATLSQVTVTASGLTASACGSPAVAPCSRLEIGGGGVTVTNLTLSGSTFTFDLAIATNAPIGSRTITIVNHFSQEDAAAVLSNAFTVNQAGGVPPSGGYVLYVSDGASSQVRAYSTADNSLIGTIDANGQPNALALSPDKVMLYAAGAGDRTVGVIDTRPHAPAVVGVEVGRIGVDFNNYAYTMATAGTHVYIVNTRLGDRVIVLNAQTWDTIGEIVVASGAGLNALRLDPAGRYLYTANPWLSSVSVIDTASDTVVGNVALPAGVRPRGVAFRPDGQRAYVVADSGTYVLDTSAIAQPTLWSSTPLPTSGGYAGAIDVAPYPTDPARSFAYIVSGGRLYVFDAASDPPTLVRSIPVGRSPMSVRATPDGGRVFVAHSSSKDLYVVDTANLLTSPAVSATKFDTVVTPSGGMIVGPIPSAAPASAPVVSSISISGGSPARNGVATTVTLGGSNFDAQPIVWVKGTLVRGTSVSGTGGTLTFTLPQGTPSGDYPIVVSNQRAGANESGVSTALLAVRPPDTFLPSQTVYVSDNAHARVTQLRPGADPAQIPTQPFPGGLAIAPDGKTAFVLHNYVGPQLINNVVADQYLDGAILDLNPLSPTYRTVVKTLPAQFNSANNPAVPSFQDPRGVFYYSPSGGYLDSISVVNPVTLAEVDINPAAGTASILPGDPSMGVFEPRLRGINRIPLDSYETDANTYPYGAVITPDGSLLYVVNIGYGGDSDTPAVNPGVLIVDPFAHAVVGHITTADGGPIKSPQFLAAAPRGLASDMPPYAAGTVFVHVAGYDGNNAPTLFIFKAGETNETAAFVDRIVLPEFPLAVGVSEDGLTVYLTLRISGRLAMVNVTPRADGSGRVDGTISYLDLAPGVTRLAAAYADRLLYVGNPYRSAVYALDVTVPTAPVLVTTLGVQTPANIAVQPVFNRPRVAAISPPKGASAGGTAVTITGANFASNATVHFRSAGGGYVAATSVAVVDAFTITALTPPGTGIADVRVTNPTPEPVSDVLAGRYQYLSDITPPVFTVPPYIASQTLQGNTVTVEIRWTTDEASTSRVDYGTGGTLSLNVSNPTLVADHVITISQLNPAVAYAFRATSVDSQGNSNSSPASPATSPFTTLALPDTTPPEITSGPSSSRTTTSATIVWTTNEDSTSVVRYDGTIDGAVSDSAASTTGASGLSHSVTINGLTPGTTYEYKVVSADATGNPRTSGVATFSTAALPDTTPPAITSGPTVSYLSSDLVIVTWTTDELSNSFINYGVSSIYEQSIVDSDKVTTHVMFLTNLLPGTNYGFQVGSTDASGNSIATANPFGALQALGVTRLTADMKMGDAILSAGTMLAVAAPAVGFATPQKPDTTPPSVTGSVVITPLAYNKAVVTVTTDETASILARFTAGAVSGSAFDPAFTTEHSLLLTGLSGGTRYDVTVVLTDPKGNARTVTGLSFTTPATPDTQPPVLTNLSAATASPTTATISWTTNEPADSVVRYTTSGTPENSALQSALTTSHAVTLTGLKPGATYTVNVTSADASGNRSTPLTTTFTTPRPTPSITGVTPDRLAQGSQNARLTIAGANFEQGAQVTAGGAGVTLSTQSVDADGSRIVLLANVDAGALLGSRALTVTNPNGGPSGSGGALTIVDASAPTITISTPAAGATLTNATATVAGTISEMATVTVNGTSATVSGGGPYSFEATVTLPGGGTHHIVVVAVDGSGNRGSAVVDVTVTDGQPPQLTVMATPAVLWPPNHKLVPVTIAVTVSDDLDPAPTVQLVSVTSNEPDSGTGPEDVPGDIDGVTLGTDDRTVLLRAERSDTGPGRVYTLTYRATDRAGNSTERKVTVTVPHDQR